MANIQPIPDLVPIPDGYRRIAREEVTPELLEFARVAESHKLPIGKIQSGIINGVHVAALTDWHHSGHRNPNKRKVWHPAISLLVQKSFQAPHPSGYSSASGSGLQHRPPPPPPLGYQQSALGYRQEDSAGPLQRNDSPGPLQHGDSPGPLQSASFTASASTSSPALSEVAAVVKAAPAAISTAKSAISALSDLNLSGSVDVSGDEDLQSNLEAAGDTDVETAAEFGASKRPRKHHKH